MNTKIIEPITWKTWKPLKPEDFPCLFHREREATKKVTVNGKFTMMICDQCAELSAKELLKKRERRSKS